ncbi:MAG TPA: TIGR01906 family membrane protein [Firmicutes bacterium]|nr:TIGR01906 family membrane protein [Bacillota bacterium]
MKKIAVICAAFLLPVIIILSSVQLVVQNDAFFRRQYEANNVAENTQIELPELMRVTDEIQAYLFGSRDDFNIHGTVGGEYRPLFAEREILHMADVRGLFALGLLVRNCALALLLLLGLYLLQADKILLAKAFQGGCLFFVALGAAGGLLLAVQFDRMFVLFHELFFNNDLWLLDPQESILINMVPQPFFVAASTWILLTAAMLSGLAGVAGWLLRRRWQEEALPAGRHGD